MDIYGLNVLARWANGFDSAAAYYRLISSLCELLKGRSAIMSEGGLIAGAVCNVFA